MPRTLADMAAAKGREMSVQCGHEVCEGAGMSRPTLQVCEVVVDPASRAAARVLCNLVEQIPYALLFKHALRDEAERLDRDAFLP